METRLLPLIVALLVPSEPLLCFGAQPYHRTMPDGGITAGIGQDQSGYLGLDQSIFCSGQPYHWDWTGMGQDQCGFPGIRTHGGDKVVLWCPTVPPNCARRGHHSRNGPGAEWPPQDSNSWWRQGYALVPNRTTELCETGASQPKWARGRVASVYVVDYYPNRSR